MNEQNNIQLEDNIENFLNCAIDGNYSYSKAKAMLAQEIKDSEVDFLSNNGLKKITKTHFENFLNYDEEDFEEFLEELSDKHNIEYSRTQSLNTQNNILAGMSKGNVINSPVPIAQSVSDFEAELEADEQSLSNQVRDLVDDFGSEAKCEEYGYRFGKGKLNRETLYKVDKVGEKDVASKAVAKINLVGNTIEFYDEGVTSPEVAEIMARKARELGWTEVSLTPPSGSSAQAFMELNLRTVMNTDYGYEPSEVFVPKEYESLKMAIAAELRNTASLKQSSPESEASSEPAPVEPENPEQPVDHSQAEEILNSAKPENSNDSESSTKNKKSNKPK